MSIRKDRTQDQYLDVPIIYVCPSCKDETTWKTLRIPRTLECKCGEPMIAQNMPERKEQECSPSP